MILSAGWTSRPEPRMGYQAARAMRLTRLTRRRILPLTRLADDERLLFDSVLEFAAREIGPAGPGDGRAGGVSGRPRAKALRARRDGHRDARAPRRQRRHLLPRGPGGRGAGARGRVGRRARGRPEHAGHQRAHALGQRRAQQRATCRRLAATTVGAYALSEAGSGSDAFALQTRAVEAGDDLRAHRPQALDHQREGGRPLHRLCDGRSRGRLPAASPRSSSSAARPASRSARRKTSWASARAAPASCCSRTAACRAPTCSARSARATRWRSRR